MRQSTKNSIYSWLIIVGLMAFIIFMARLIALEGLKIK